MDTDTREQTTPLNLQFSIYNPLLVVLTLTPLSRCSLLVMVTMAM